MKKGSLIPLLAAILFAANLSNLHAVVLNWGLTPGTATWTPAGSLTHSYNVDGVAGNDVTVTISNSSPLTGGYPRVNGDLNGGVAGENGLRLQIDLPNNTAASFVTVTIDFLNPAGVLNPTFSLFDIDTGTGSIGNFDWQDQIRNIQGSFGATTYSPTLTGGSAVTIAGGTMTGNANIPNDGAAAAAATGTISFNSGPVSQIRFDYGGGSQARTNPSNQGIAISDITYNDVSAVPEVNTLWIALAALFAAAALHLLRQQQAPRLLTRSSVE